MRTLLVNVPDHAYATIRDRAMAKRMPREDLAGQLIGAALGRTHAALSDPAIVKFHVRFRPGPGPGRTGPFDWNAQLGVVAFLMGSTDEMTFAVVYDEGHFGTVAARDCVLDDGDEDAEAPAQPSAPAVAFVDEAHAVSLTPRGRYDVLATCTCGWSNLCKSEGTAQNAANAHVASVHPLNTPDEAPAFPPLPVRKALPLQSAVKHDASAAEILLAYIDGQAVGQFVAGSLAELIRTAREAQMGAMPLDELIHRTVRAVIDAMRETKMGTWQ